MVDSRTLPPAGWTPAEAAAVIEEATSGDYDHLLATIQEHVEEPREEEPA